MAIFWAGPPNLTVIIGLGKGGMNDVGKGVAQLVKGSSWGHFDS